MKKNLKSYKNVRKKLATFDLLSVVQNKDRRLTAIVLSILTSSK